MAAFFTYFETGALPLDMECKADRALLQGTELEAVVQLKVARLDAERRLVEEVLKERVSRRTYAHACAIVASHANPWFGGH